MAEQGFTLSSSAFEPGASIPENFTCDGENESPPLQWIHPPEGTRSFALIMDDPDAPNGTFTHWVLVNIPADTLQFERNQCSGVAGKNDFEADGYGGPCPPANHGEHRYYFKLYALDIDSLDVPAGAPRQKVEQAMQGHILNETELMGRYRRRAG